MTLLRVELFQSYDFEDEEELKEFFSLFKGKVCDLLRAVAALLPQQVS
jgi:hypothetical protein